MSETALKQLTNLFHDTHARLSQMAARSINTSLVVRNWLYGWYIVEFEQGAASRQELYGKALIDQLAKSLATRGIKGISPTNLRKCQFYLVFPATDAIQQALSVESLPFKTHYLSILHPNYYRRHKSSMAKPSLISLLKSLATRGIKGISPTNLRKFLQFYLVFPATDAIQQALSVEWLAIAPTQIQQTLSVESSKQPCEPLPSKAFLVELGYE